jgi:L-ascorbate metabolism protein UlaG (beta-lactamase superfamily)
MVYNMHYMYDKTYEQLTPRPNIRTFFFFLGFLLRNVIKYFIPTQKVKQAVFDIKMDEVKIWYIGHATVLINLYGTMLLTDPVLGQGLPFPKRVKMPGSSLKNLPSIDLVLLSHAHMDHWNKSSLKKLAKFCDTVVIPAKCKDLLPTGFKNTLETNWEQVITVHELKITPIRPHHWGERYPWQRRWQRGYNSYLIQKDNKTIFFAGDTASGEMFKKIGAENKIDVALLPITSYNPPSFRTFHLNPDDAIVAFQELNAKYLIPIHWGNFNLSLEPIEEPPKWLRESAKDKGIADRVKILDNGESFSLSLTQ